MALYDAIGKDYAKTRKRDPRLAKELLNLLSIPPKATVLDVGAGTGSYSLVLAKEGYRVLAVEPSIVMRNQACKHSEIQWIDACAEKIPLRDRAADAAIAILALHHFQNGRKAIQEMARITGNGQLVFLTYNPAKISTFWLAQYFPSFITDVRRTFIPLTQLLAEIKSITGKTAEVKPFFLPCNLMDSFAAVGWSRPELYLDPQIRSGISSFAQIDSAELTQGLTRLQQDLEQGKWDRKYGYLRQEKCYDAGYCFVRTLA